MILRFAAISGLAWAKPRLILLSEAKAKLLESFGVSQTVALCLVGLLLAAVAPASAKTLVYCSEANPESLNPQVVTSVTGMNAAEPMFDGLVRLELGGGGIVSGLAESWTVSPDGTEYLFHLRHGVKFHANAHFTPTRDFNADDVLFSFNRQWHDNPFHHPIGPSFNYFEDMELGKLLAGIDRIDDYTIRFRLVHAEAPFLADLAMPFAMILSAEYADAVLKTGNLDTFDSEPIGTGPFTFESFRENMTLRYKAFADYWGGRPKVDSLVFSITPNASVRLTKLKAGECQIMSFPNPADAEKIARDPQLKLLRQEGLNISYMAMNASRPPFDDIRVRRAVNLAIDKATLVRAVYGSSGTPAKNPMPPTLWAYNDQVVPYPYDPTEAQRLMSEAGLGSGFDLDLWYMPVTRAYNPDSRRVAEMVSDDLARIGIRTHLRTEPWTEYRERLLAGEPMMSFYGWTSDNGDPDNFLGILLGCRDGHPYANNIAKWCDPTFEDLILRAKLTPDTNKRAELYKQAQVIAHDQAPWVPIAHGVVLGAIREGVTGFKLDPFGRFLFQDVDFELP
jgi:dipeptide transport system substrate-binding protein